MLTNKYFQKIAFKLLNGSQGYYVKKIYSIWVSKRKNRLLTNVFKTNYHKRALISYLTEPFEFGLSEHHTNYLECHTAATILHELGYSVDVIHLFADRKINYRNYNLIYGLGDVLENFFLQEPEAMSDIITIHYCAGVNTDFSNIQGISFLLNTAKNNKPFLVNSLRINTKSHILSRAFSSGLIVLGNDYTADTYNNPPHRGTVEYLPAFFYKRQTPDFYKKDYNKARKHFLWFGSAGLVHKGLSILLDVFRNQPDWHLHICGIVKAEVQFEKYYYQDLYHSPNIHVHGFVQINDIAFVHILHECAWCVLPSISEGGAPSVLTAVGNGGLIPIVTASCGLNFYSFSPIIDQLTVEHVHKLFTKLVNTDSDFLRENSEEIYKEVNQQYTPELYKTRLKALIQKVVEV